jgi:hypothetical protein
MKHLFSQNLWSDSRANDGKESYRLLIFLILSDIHAFNKQSQRVFIINLKNVKHVHFEDI